MSNRGLSIEELISEEKGPIFVINTSHEVSRGGDVFVSVMVGGNNRPFRVPRTWIPVEVTRSLPRKAILESVYFMEALSKGLLRAISIKEAKALMAKRGYQEEIDRMKEREESIKSESSAKGIGKNVTVSGSGSLDDEEERKPKVAKKGVSVTSLGDDSEEDGAEDIAVSATFRAFTNTLNTLDHTAAMNKLRSRGDGLEQEEALYLIDNLDPDHHKRLIRGLKKQLDL